MNDTPHGELLGFPSNNHSSEEAARAAAIKALEDAGLPLIALRPRSKEPRYPNWQVDPRMPPMPADNIGIRHDFTADVDVDQPQFAPIFLAALPNTGARWGRPSAPATHFLYQVPHGRKRKFRGLAGDRPFGEIHAGSGHQSMAPGSVHPAGEPVRWESGCGPQPTRVEFEELERRAALGAAASLIASQLEPGNLHDLSVAATGVILRAGFDADLTARVIGAVRDVAGCEVSKTTELLRDIPKLAQRLADGGDGVPGIPKLKELLGREAADLITDWLGLREQMPVLFGFNDNANAELIFRKYRENIRWDVGRGVWLTCDLHGFFVEDKRGTEIITLAQDALRGWIYEAAMEPDTAKRRKMLEHGNQSLNLHATMRALELLKTKPGISRLSDEFNSNPWLLGTQNGVLDLRLPDGPKLRPATPRDLITQRAGTTWNPESTPTIFLGVLSAIFDGDAERIRYFQRVCGAMLVGVLVQTLFFWHGLGANGKSLLKNVILLVLGDYGGTLSASAIEASGDDLAMLELAGLQHKRAVFTVETRQNKRVNSVLLKLISGEDTIHVRVLYVGIREYRPHFKLIILGNHKPNIDPDDEAMWRRLQMTPFNHRFTGPECDPDLLAKLRDELPAILRWMVDGCIEWQRIGLCPPSGVLHATREYRAEQDLFDQWLGDACELGDGLTSTFQELHRSYEDYARGVKGKSYTTTAFGGRLVGAGLQKLTRKDIPTTYAGARIRLPHRQEKF